MTQAVNDWNRRIITEFRENEGKVGGQFKDAPVLILHTTGAKSGQPRENPLMYLQDGDRILIFASKGGARSHPDWYRNLKKNPNVTLEVGAGRYDATAEEITGEERDRLYTKQGEIYPQFAGYQKDNPRTIPVVALRKK